MLGSGPGDDDVVGMGSDQPPRTPLTIGRRTRFLLAAVGACALLAVVAVFAVSRTDARTPGQQALQKLVREVTTVRVSTGGAASVTLSDGGLSSSASSITSVSAQSLAKDLSEPGPISGPPLTAGGKPEVLYVENGYCPYCVAETWPLIVALSRFGTFSGLSTSRSPRFEGIAPSDGWTFSGASYSSRYLSFVPVETHSTRLVTPTANPAHAASYRVLQKLTPAEQGILGTYDKLEQTPFFDFGGQTVMLGSTLSPSVLAGLNWNQIAADLRRPRTAAGQAIISGVGVLTAQFCQLTDDRPVAACADVDG